MLPGELTQHEARMITYRWLRAAIDTPEKVSGFGFWSKDENQHVIQIIHVQLSKHLQSHLNMISHFLMTSIELGN